MSAMQNFDEKLGNYDVRKDSLLFIDLELTCWADGERPEGEFPEIVEIGIVDVDVEKLEIKRSQGFFIQPQCSSVSSFMTDLTGITASMVKRQGRPLAEVFGTLRKWGIANKAWMAWGSDRKALDRDCHAKGLIMPFSAQFFDYGLWHTLVQGAGRAVSLDTAASSLDRQRTGTAHRAESDAVLTAECWLEETRRARFANPALRPASPMV